MALSHTVAGSLSHNRVALKALNTHGGDPNNVGPVMCAALTALLLTSYVSVRVNRLITPSSVRVNHAPALWSPRPRSRSKPSRGTRRWCRLRSARCAPSRFRVAGGPRSARTGRLFTDVQRPCFRRRRRAILPILGARLNAHGWPLRGALNAPGARPPTASESVPDASAGHVRLRLEVRTAPVDACGVAGEGVRT